MKSSHRGFTMIELMVTVAIVAILATIAAPNLTSFLDSSRLGAFRGDLVSSLALAKSEAMKRGSTVSLSPIAPSTDLRDGWVVFVDEDTPTGIASGTSTVVAQQGAYGSNLESTAFISGGQRFVAFDRLGRSILTNNGAGLGRVEMKVVDGGGAMRKQGTLCVAWGGRTRYVPDQLGASVCAAN